MTTTLEEIMGELNECEAGLVTCETLSPAESLGLSIALTQARLTFFLIAEMGRIANSLEHLGENQESNNEQDKVRNLFKY